MFDNFMQNAEGMQAEMLAELKGIILKEEFEGITIEANAAREILNISIPDTYYSITEREKLEDLLVIGINKLMVKISEKEKEQSQNLIKKMMPSGFGNLFE
jgi:DNA-binding protein YbaB